ncbi:MAG TPA: long-chain fatty acid--CoA ligase [Polyangiaceae bacterium]|nr:long-chain fatty acid--CoA ligase [Polyangiaceae bacterium]
MAQYQTLVDLIERSITLHASRPALGTKRADGFAFITYAELGERIARMRAGLSQASVGPGDRVALIADNREEWVVVAAATYGLGAQLVPMYQAQLPRDWAHILADSGAKVVFAANDAIVQKLKKERQQLPMLQHVFTLEGDGEGSYAHLLTLGTRPVLSPAPSDVACFIYTSGTTGLPKGVELTHANIVSNINGIHQVFSFEPNDRSLSLLPWAHSFGQVCELYLLLSMGCSIAINDQQDAFLENLREVEPTLLFAVPRIFNKLYRVVHDQVAGSPAFAQALFRDGIRLALDKLHHKPLKLLSRVELALSDKLVFAKVRAKFGGRLRYAISASATLGSEVAEFVQALGITVYEGYGLTETSPIVSSNYPGNQKLGSVGKPIPEVRVVIDTRVSSDAKSGEIIVYGPNVMRGYHNLPGETRGALTDDGGLRTGDLGYLDEDGYLFITGRIKEQYKLENGKYVMPAPLEEQLKLSPLIANVIIYGDNRAYNVALVVPDGPALLERAAQAGVAADSVSDSPALRRIVQQEIDRLAADFRGYERLRKCALLSEDFSCENGLLTPTLKLKRKAVVACHQDKLNELYAEPRRAESPRAP